MSATLPPPTKPCGGRPPIFPPTFTTFDGMNDDNGREPIFRIIAADAERLLRSVPSWPDEDLAMLLRLLEQRMAVVDQELAMERMIDKQPLPPSGFGEAFPVDYIFNVESEAAGTYLNLYFQLFDAIVRVKKKMRLLNGLLPSSEV